MTSKEVRDWQCDRCNNLFWHESELRQHLMKKAVYDEDLDESDISSDTRKYSVKIGDDIVWFHKVRAFYQDGSSEPYTVKPPFYDLPPKEDQ